MARVNVEHTCGHEEVHHLRRGQSPGYLEGRKCFACFQQEQFILARAEAIAGSWPDLEGSERQVMWAMSLRAHLWRQLQEEIADVLHKAQGSTQTKDKARAVLEAHADSYLRVHTTARWWIDRGRYTSPRTILRGALGQLREDAACDMY